jgi:hypothetical protein
MVLVFFKLLIFVLWLKIRSFLETVLYSDKKEHVLNSC